MFDATISVWPTPASTDRLIRAPTSLTAVDGVSFAVEQGEIFGILGPNGAGKTTTAECIEGLRDPVDWRALIDTLGLTDKLDTQFRRLSGGQKQRLSIALALLGDPKAVVLDELTTGLDPQARRDVWDLIEGIRDRGVTILMVTHFMEEAERLCDRLAVIDSGRLAAVDTPAGLVSTVDDRQRIRFRPSAPLDHALLTALPEVTSVERAGSQLVVAGTGNLLHAVSTLLAHHQVIAADLRVEQTTLDDAFVALTGQPIEK